MLWITVTSGCFAFVFQQPMGIGLEIRLARGPDFQRMTKGPLGTRLYTVRKRIAEIKQNENGTTSGLPGTSAVIQSSS